MNTDETRTGEDVIGPEVQFFRRYGAWLLVGLISTAMLYVLAEIYFTHRHEERVAQLIMDEGGDVQFESIGPSWLTQFTILSRLNAVEMCGFGRMATAAASGEPLQSYPIPEPFFEELKSLRNLTRLSLKKSTVTDSDLEHLRQLTYLEQLDLTETQTTADGRNLLRKELPDCKIIPDP
jgi:hypothetical protein